MSSWRRHLRCTVRAVGVAGILRLLEDGSRSIELGEAGAGDGDDTFHE